MKQGGSEAAKQRAGESAAERVADGQVVGLGTGSTAAHAIRAIGRRVDAGLEVTGVPTSFQSRELASAAGIPLAELDEVSVDLAIDGADQVADVNGTILGKPGTRDNARAQLRCQSGQTVLFHSGLCVCAPAFEHPRSLVETVTTRFRQLTDEQIARYVEAEDVTATAGSIKSEGLGISLVEAIESRDPTALVGLPLIALRNLLEQAGIAIP